VNAGKIPSLHDEGWGFFLNPSPPPARSIRFGGQAWPSIW